MGWLLFAVLVGAAAAVFGGAPFGTSDKSARAVASTEAQPLPTMGVRPLDDSGATISGRVIERIDVEKYTYLRLDTGARPTWTAVSSADVNVGETVRVVDAELMTSFVSATLKRTFDQIYFGELAAATSASAVNDVVLPLGALGDDPHAGIPGAPPLAARAGLSADANPHATPSRTGDSVVVGKVVKAAGKSGRTVAEIYSQGRALKDATVRVRGVVTKSILGVLGKSFVHVRDGSGKAETRDHDLTVTTAATPAVGDRVLLEGKVTVDKDFGAGYSYPVLLEDAILISE